MSEMLPIIFALLVGLTYYWSNKLNIRHTRYYHRIVSVSAGISITYLLLELFPLFTEGAFRIHKLLFLSVLVGFIIHHVIEKEIYQHNRRHELIKMLNLEENIFSFFYHIILGMLLVTFFSRNLLQSILFFITIVAFTLVSTLPLSRHGSGGKAFALSSSTLIGVLFSLFIWTNRAEWIEFSLIGLTVGILLYTVIRHHIPYGRKGRIWYFTLGFLVYALIIVSSWYV